MSVGADVVISVGTVAEYDGRCCSGAGRGGEGRLIENSFLRSVKVEVVEVELTAAETAPEGE